MKTKLQLGLGYFGGKQKQAKFMEKFFPTFSRYCEPFGGTMKNFLNTTMSCQDVVYNDISYYQAMLIAAFKFPKKFRSEFKKQLKPGGYLYHPGLTDTIKNKVVLEAHYKDLFYTLSNHYAYSGPNPKGEIKYINWVDAVLYGFCLAHSILGIPLKSFTYSLGKSSKPRFSKVITHLDEHIKQQKFKPVKYFVGDALDIIKAQDKEDAFFMCDPGYVNMEHYYRNRGRKGSSQKIGKRKIKSLFDEKMHVGLADTLKGTRGKFMVCYYYHPILEKLYPRHKYTWIMKEYNRTSANTAKTIEQKNEKGMEILIINYGQDPKMAPALKEHLLASAKAYMPSTIGRRSRASYSLMFKHNVINMIDSKLFTKKEILNGLGIKSYNTLSKWESEKHEIETTLVRLKEAKEYLRTTEGAKGIKVVTKSNGIMPTSQKVRDMVAILYKHRLATPKDIRTLFGINNDCIKNCYKEWSDEKKAVSRKTKIARALVYWHKMAA